MAFHRSGDTVPVLFEPANPVNAYIDFWPELWLVVAVFAVVGVAFVVGSMVVAIYLLRA